MVKILGTLALVAVSLLIFLMLFSVVDSKFECSGETSSKGERRPATLWMELKRYRWWVKFWSDSEGNMTFEMTKVPGAYYGHVKSIGHVLQISEVDYTGQERRLKPMGHFSTLSQSLSIQTYAGEFVGNCKKMN